MEFYNCFLIIVFVLLDIYDIDGYNFEVLSIINILRFMYRYRVYV